MNGRGRGGQILPMVMISMVVIIIIIYGLVQWLQNDANWSVKQQKSTTAANMAETGLDRGAWKLQSSTFTWAQAYAGTVIPGYNFDTTYTDVSSGTYRIKFVAGVNNQVTIWAEGRDILKKETRSIQEVVQNQTIYSAMMSGGNVTWSRGLVLYWGPIISQGDITLADDFVGVLRFPRKYAKGTVIGSPTYPRDTNLLIPPNTDNTEWWSAYLGVPNVPLLDFVALRSSAAATGTLNIYGCKGTGAAWDLQPSCPSGAPHATHFGDSMNYVSAVLGDATHTKDFVWYWDGDLTLTGSFCGNSPCNESTGLRGTVIVRGNLTINTPGDFVYNGHVPANAWKEEQNLLVNPPTADTAASQEYPADIGFHSSTGTWGFGTSSWCQPSQGCGWKATVGIRGLTYVGQNLTIINYMDFHGAVWVNGAVNASGGDATHFCTVFYDDTLTVPALNVILLRQSWQEVAPSAIAWP